MSQYLCLVAIRCRTLGMWQFQPPSQRPLACPQSASASRAIVGCIAEGKAQSSRQPQERRGARGIGDGLTQVNF